MVPARPKTGSSELNEFKLHERIRAVPAQVAHLPRFSGTAQKPVAPLPTLLGSRESILVTKLVSSFAAAAIFCAGTVRAEVIDITVPGTTLQQVIGNQFIVGNHLFTLNSNAFSSSVFNPSQIFITPVLNADPTTGAGFRLTGAFGDPPGGGSSTFTLSYAVDMQPAAIAAGMRFDRADLRFNGSSSGDGSMAGVTESISSSNEGALGTLNVSNNAGGTPVFQDQTIFASNTLTELSVVDDGHFLAAGDSGTSSDSFNDFSFGDRSVPTPGAITILAAGAAILVRRSRR